MIQLLASGIAAAHAEISSGAALKVPYPPALQRALDQLTLRCVLVGERTEPAEQPSWLPAGVPELLRWCERPLDQWPVPLGGSDAAGEVLLDLGAPTRMCHEWALPIPDVEGEAFENAIIADVRAKCQAAGRQDSYVAFRQLVISTPVLTELDLQEKLMTSELQIVAQSVQQCYPPVPAECRFGDRVLQCADCDNLLVRFREEMWCVNDRCTRQSTAREGGSLPLSQGVRWLAAPIRTFVAAPGRAELRLARELSRLGVDVELWPQYDTYDLRIVFPDQQVWAVDVKDWSNPVRLAKRLRAIPSDPEWHEAYYVPAREAVAATAGYLKTLRERSRAALRGTRVGILSEQGLLNKVKGRLETDA
ncbi:hypothetical protein IU443_21985 [Nocardia farcinica]|uniref:pPIWI_RE_Y domain-containing protein n=1 Tax=Nocardia farcinica TaxID=37329 RepID=UPI0011458CF3|nr:hypothetical protein [Nocardia farcinica]MBF6263590.1 hypothetical protein [Nocardia farcinica]MBF6282203.1 hypothetical protein [Nocardia farcinica]MBF6306383.1 hypothetical protein [Nocardia farcinica]MBF6392617.1 hypothetical protein [Nocardia farcinica]MBF6489439.1 hypothetical protein [Nocardia farcinica]